MSATVDGIYYPWIAMSDLGTLKKALIYFDKVYLLCPPTCEEIAQRLEAHRDVSAIWDQQAIHDFEKHLGAFFQFQAATSDLVREGVLQFVDPYAFGVPSLARKVDMWSASNVPDDGEEHASRMARADCEFDTKSRVLTESILSDFRAPSFCRLPTGLTAFVGMGWMFDYGLSGATFSEFYAYNLWEVMIGQGTAAPETLTLDPSHLRRPKGDRWPHRFEIDVMSYVAQSLIINRTLLAADHLNAAPFTDQADHFAFMEEKLSRIAESCASSGAFRARFPDVAVKEPALASRVLETQLPNLEEVEWDDILTIRQRAKQELQRFRIEIAALATEVQIGTAESLESQVRDLVAKKIAPALADLEAALRLSRSRVLRTAFSKAQSLKPFIPFSVSVIAGAPPALGLLVSAGLLGLDTALELYAQRREIRASSGLSYLLNYR